MLFILLERAKEMILLAKQELQNESRQQNRQQNKTKWREEEI